MQLNPISTPPWHFVHEPKPRRRAQRIQPIVPAEVHVARAFLKMTGLNLDDLPPPDRAAARPAAAMPEPPPAPPAPAPLIVRAHAFLRRLVRAVHAFVTPFTRSV